MSIGDLGKAIRKIRIDLKIPIDFEEWRSDPVDSNARLCSMGVIRYSAIDGPCEDGHLIVLKPMLLGNESQDVLGFSKEHPDFPHQSTCRSMVQ